MRRTLKESKAAERELGGESRSELRDRPAATGKKQALDAHRPGRPDDATGPPAKRAEQRSTSAGIIPMQGGRSNGKPITLQP